MCEKTELLKEIETAKQRGEISEVVFNALKKGIEDGLLFSKLVYEKNLTDYKLEYTRFSITDISVRSESIFIYTDDMDKIFGFKMCKDEIGFYKTNNQDVDWFLRDHKLTNNEEEAELFWKEWNNEAQMEAEIEEATEKYRKMIDDYLEEAESMICELNGDTDGSEDLLMSLEDSMWIDTPHD